MKDTNFKKRITFLSYYKLFYFVFTDYHDNGLITSKNSLLTF